MRERILEAAFDCFARRGYEAVSTRDIARTAKVGPASMYRHFPTKEALGRELYTVALRPLLEDLDRLLATTKDAQEVLARTAELMCHWYDTRPRALALLVFPPHDFMPDQLSSDNSASPRRRLQAFLECDDDTLAVIWGALTGPMADRYLRQRSGTMQPQAAGLSAAVAKLAPHPPGLRP